MQPDEIINILNGIFRDVLDNDNISLGPATTAQDIAEWDSLNHIQLVVAIEKKFKIKFPTLEIQNWKNVGEMCNSILNRINK
jgi:acyl carrier protein